MIKNKLILGLFLGMIVSVAKSKETTRDKYYKTKNKMDFKKKMDKIAGSNNTTAIEQLESEYSLKAQQVPESSEELEKEEKEEYKKLSLADRCIVFCNNHKKGIAAVVTTFTIVGIVVGVKTGNINLGANTADMKRE